MSRATEMHNLQIDINDLKERLDLAVSHMAYLKAEERKETNRDRIGECYTYRNSYSCPTTEADYWLIWARIVDLDSEGRPIVLQFETDKYGKITIDRTTWLYENAGWGRVSQVEYEVALAELQATMVAIFKD